jgi:uncharacterized protein (TIGR02265 family)
MSVEPKPPIHYDSSLRTASALGGLWAVLRVAMTNFEYSVHCHQSLNGDVQLEALLRETPAYFSVKGLFIASLGSELPPDRWESVLETLEAPPSNRRHAALTNYPVRDLQRVIHALAESLYADLGTREGFRQAGRRVFSTFASSTFGRAIVATVGDAMSAILKYPSTYHLAAQGGLASAKQLGPRTVRVRWDDYAGSSEYALGLLEGVALAYGHEPHARVTVSAAPQLAGRELRLGWHQVHMEW